jgi:pimeloyl-ACP methyl ester carboxylesterase
MKNNLLNKFAVFFLLWMALALTSCQGGAPLPTETPTPTATETPQHLATRPAATIQPATPEPTLHLFPTFTTGPLVADIKKIDIGGRKLNLVCMGSGSKTVVFDSGLGIGYKTWIAVMQQVQDQARVCAYDRAGLGDSDPAPTPRTSQQMGDDLKALLSKGHVPGPYILVAHATASFDALLYAHKYPREVAGIILVDGSHPDQYTRSAAILPTPASDENPGLAAARKQLTELDPAQNPERLDFNASAEQVRAVKSLGSIPLTVLTRRPLDAIQDVPPEVVSRLEQDWVVLQNALATLSQVSTHQFASHAGHNIPDEEPELVVNAITSLLSSLK